MSEVADTAQKVHQTVEDTVNTILLKAIDAATAGAEFLKEQIPDVLQQLLRYKLWTGVLDSALCITTIITVSMTGYYFFARSFGRKAKAFTSDQQEMYGQFFIGTLLFGGVSNVGLTFALVCSLQEVIEIVLAPKVYLLEYAAHLVRH